MKNLDKTVEDLRAKSSKILTDPEKKIKDF